MSSKTIDGVPRELLQDFLDTALAAGHHYFDNQQLDALRGLLDKPVPFPGYRPVPDDRKLPAAQHQGEPVAVVATPPSTGSGTMKLIELVAASITIWPADAYCFAQDSDGYCFSFRSEPLANGSCWDGRVASETFLAEPCVDRATTFVTRQQWEAYRLGFKQKSEQPAPVAVVMPNVDELAQIIRKVDGSHTLGAGSLAEAILGEVAKLNRVKP